MPLGNDGCVKRTREADGYAIVRLVHLSGIAGLDPDHLGALDQALRTQEADGQLVLVSGRPHRDRDGDRRLARTGGADLQRLLADDTVRAVLEGGSADGHDAGRRDVAGRRGGISHRRQFRSVQFRLIIAQGCIIERCRPSRF